MYLLSELEKLIWPGKFPPSPTQTVSPFDSRVMPALMASKLTLIAKSRIDWFAFVKLPYLKLNSPSTLSWKVFEFTTSKPILYEFANSFSSLKSLTLSHGKWGETFSVIPTRSLITAQSSIFSKILFAADITIEMLNKLEKRNMVFSEEIIKIRNLLNLTIDGLLLLPLLFYWLKVLVKFLYHMLSV